MVPVKLFWDTSRYLHVNINTYSLSAAHPVILLKKDENVAYANTAVALTSVELEKSGRLPDIRFFCNCNSLQS